MKRTIIYVFGPKRLAATYYENGEMARQEGGWLKIGQTSTTDDAEDKWDSALSRVRAEVRTGIPEVCRLYDVFEYPYMEGNNDDVLRTILAEDIYTLDNSKSHNHDIEQYEIKAGREFVYGVTRGQVLNAIAKFERNLILKYYGKPQFEVLIELICKNNSAENSPFEQNAEDEAPQSGDSVKPGWCDTLWERVFDGVKKSVDVQVSIPKGRPYAVVKSGHKAFAYVLGYSVRYSVANVSIETYQGGETRDNLNLLIEQNNISAALPGLRMRSGVKNANKWSWSVSASFERSDDGLITWFVDTFVTFYNEFENSLNSN